YPKKSRKSILNRIPVTVTAPLRNQTAKYGPARNYIGGQFTAPDTRLLEVLNPSDGSLLSKVPLSSSEEVDAAVRAGAAAFSGWSGTPIKERVQVFYRYRT